MAIILDADLIIRGEKGQFNLMGWFEDQANEEFAVAAITIAELWHGVERGTGRHRLYRQQYLESVVGSLSVIPYTIETAYHHARLWAELVSAGKMIGYYDVIVAATALEHHSRLATFNKRHFGVVKGLTLIEPK